MRVAVYFTWQKLWWPGPNFMALLTLCKESVLTEADVKHISRISRKFVLVPCILHVTRHSSLTQLAQKFYACTVNGEWWKQVQNSALSRAMKLGPVHESMGLNPGRGNVSLVKTLDSNFFPSPSSKCLTVRVKFVSVIIYLHVQQFDCWCHRLLLPKSMLRYLV